MRSIFFLVFLSNFSRILDGSTAPTMVILLAATSAFTASTPVTTKTNHARIISININNFDFFFLLLVNKGKMKDRNMNKVKPSKERAYLTILLAQPSQCMSTFKITVTELFLSSFFFSATASPSSSSFFFSASLLPLLLSFSLLSFSLLLLLFFFFCKN